MTITSPVPCPHPPFRNTLSRRHGEETAPFVLLIPGDYDTILPDENIPSPPSHHPLFRPSPAGSVNIDENVPVPCPPHPLLLTTPPHPQAGKIKTGGNVFPVSITYFKGPPPPPPADGCHS